MKGKGRLSWSWIRSKGWLIAFLHLSINTKHMSLKTAVFIGWLSIFLGAHMSRAAPVTSALTRDGWLLNQPMLDPCEEGLNRSYVPRGAHTRCVNYPPATTLESDKI